MGELDDYEPEVGKWSATKISRLARIAGLREAAEIVDKLDAAYIGAQGCFKEAKAAILARIAELENRP